jgi:hypothetical protein
MKAPHDGSVTTATDRGCMQGKQLQRTHTRVQLSDYIRINGRGDQIATWKQLTLFPDTRPDLPFGLTAISKQGKIIHTKSVWPK